MRSAHAISLFFAALLLHACGEQGDETRTTTEAMAEAHKDDAPIATPAVDESPATLNVIAENVDYGELDDKPLRGYLAKPSGDSEGLPGLVVIHEWWGLNDNIRAMTDKLAGEGYVALAVDLYDGLVAEQPDQAHAAVQQAMAAPKRLEANIQQAIAYLQKEQLTRTIGSIGWCFGGGWSLRTGVMAPADIDAMVMYYGPLIENLDQLDRLNMPVLGIFGAEDKAIPPQQVEVFAQNLGRLGKNFEIVVYSGADHAFANPSGTRYQAEAADKAWRRTLAFLHANL
jgi:carboxymethylenebutenolidase